jgi:DUF4097 and DUF4098 domain-containing protein YvlB
MKKKIAAISYLLAAAVLFWGCDASVNRSKHLADGERSTGMSSVNGSIHVGSNCIVDGGCHTVNGRVEVGDGSQVEALKTVNGRIRIGAHVDVGGEAGTVNGSIECGPGSKVHGNVHTVNGRVELRGTVVDDEVSTVNGDVLLRDKSVVHGDIIIKGRSGHFFGGHDRGLEIRLAGGSMVEGGIDVRDPDRKVKVYVDKDSKVNGEIRNAEVIKE